MLTAAVGNYLDLVMGVEMIVIGVCIDAKIGVLEIKCVVSACRVAVRT